MMRKVFLFAVLLAMSLPLLADGPQTTTAVKAQVITEQPQTSESNSVLLLQDVVREALAKNPAIASASHSVNAQRAKVSQAKALPDPTFGVGWMGNIRPFSVQTNDPSSYRSVGAMQMLPYPGKRGLRGEIASKEADATQWDYEALRRRITA